MEAEAEARQRQLARALSFCATYAPARPTERLALTGLPAAGRPAVGPRGLFLGPRRTRVGVQRRDALEVALDLLQVVPGLRNPPPLVLILADAETPGGCVRAGAGMQEESLFRRTALFAHLRPEMYPIREGEALYAPDVPVLDDAGREAHRLAFIACPGLKMPRVSDDGRALRDPEDAERVRDQARLLLRTAAARGHDALVLGALGCGAFGCPPAHVARLFAEVLEQELDGAAARIARVEFAVTGNAAHAAFAAALLAGREESCRQPAAGPPSF